MQGGSYASDDETLMSVGEEPARVWGEGHHRGDNLGRYVVLEQLGEGGMGIVYSCYDPELNRKLAIKLLRAQGGGDTRALAAEHRLLREAQAMAQLSHPNVVTVHDVGTHDGGVYVAMEFVDCVTLREWCTAGSRTWEELLRVFGEAAKGLIAAHEKGLVHRDFKPDNVLVARDGRILVTDFGLARAMDEGPIRIKTGESVLDSEGARHHWTPNEDALNQELTQVGSVMGTPAYMAPEQHAGLEVDARADQFSFCVALFEALYGRKPFEGKTLAALSFAITSGDIVDVDSGSVPSWVDAALRKGLTPAAGNRFEDMGALMAALEADPRGARRRLYAGLGFLAIAGALVGSRGMLEARKVRACEAAASALDAKWNGVRVSALRATAQADDRRLANLERMTPWLDGYAKSWKSQAQSLCRAETIEGRLSPALGEEARQCLQERADALDALVSGIEGADARGLFSLVESVSELPRVEDCSDVVFLSARPPLPEDRTQREEVVAGRKALAQVRASRAAADLEAARKRLQPIVKRAEALGYDPLIARARYEAAQVDMDAGLPKDAVADLQACLAASLRAGLDSLAARSAGWMARVHGNQMGRKDEGLAWGEMAWALHERSGGGEDLVAAELAVNVGLVHHAAVELDETQLLYERALKIRRAELGPVHPQIALVMNNLANISWARAQWDDGLRLHRDALAMRAQLLGEDHPACASSHNNIGLILHDKGDYEAAISSFQKSVGIARAAFGDHHRLVGLSSGNIGMSQEALGRLEDALAAYAIAERVAAETVDLGSPGWLEPIRGQARVALLLGRVEEAAILLERAVDAAIATLGVGHADLAGAQVELADVYLDQGRLAPALRLLEEGYPALARAYGPDNPRLLRATLVELRARLDAGRGDQAAALLATARKMAATTQGEGIEQLELRWLAARHAKRQSEVAAALSGELEALGPIGGRLKKRVDGLQP